MGRAGRFGQPSAPAAAGGGTDDHGALTGLADDDHPQYAAVAEPVAAAHIVDTTQPHDHGQLAGLGDDDHAQYLKTVSAAAVATSGSASDLATGTLPIARIADAAVTLAKLANLAEALVIGRAAGAGAGVPVGLSVAQVKTLLALTTADISGYASLLAEMHNGVRLRDDMLYGVTIAAANVNLGLLSTSMSGANTQSVAQASAWPHVGVMSMDTGSTNAGRVAFITPGSAVELGSGRARYGAVVKTPPALSTGSERYEIFAGFTDGVAAQTAATDACVLHYQDTINSGKWELLNSTNTSQTVRDTGITVAAATWYFLEVEVNAAGTSVQAYINGVAAGAPLTTTIPTGSARILGADVGIVKTVGTTASVAQLDAVGLELDFTTPR